jgi:hypothetical protein
LLGVPYRVGSWLRREVAGTGAVTLGVIVLAAALSSGAAAGRAGADDRAAVEPVMSQLEAFRRDDYDSAYGFASEEIQRIFDRAAFEQMVRTGYPEIARSAFAHVAETRDGPDGHVYVRMKIRGINGNSIEAVYDMVREDGRFRINGVVTRPDPGVVRRPPTPGRRAA